MACDFQKDFHKTLKIVTLQTQAFNNGHLVNSSCILNVEMKLAFWYIKTLLVSLQNCSKDFSEEYKLRRHVKEVHEGLKEHVCATCGKGFARADKLFQHELVHVTKSDRPVEWVPIQV